MKNINLQDLPQSALELIEIIGANNTVQLIQKLGGVRYPVPLAENNNAQGKARFDELTSVIGIEAAQSMVQHFGGTFIEIPVARKALGLAMVKTLRAQGKTIEHMVRATGYSRRNVLNLLNEIKQRKPEVQNTLF